VKAGPELVIGNFMEDGHRVVVEVAPSARGESSKTAWASWFQVHQRLRASLFSPAASAAASPTDKNYGHFRSEASTISPGQDFFRRERPMTLVEQIEGDIIAFQGDRFKQNQMPGTALFRR